MIGYQKKTSMMDNQVQHSGILGLHSTSVGSQPLIIIRSTGRHCEETFLLLCLLRRVMAT